MDMNEESKAIASPVVPTAPIPTLPSTPTLTGPGNFFTFILFSI